MLRTPMERTDTGMQAYNTRMIRGQGAQRQADNIVHKVLLCR